LAAGVDLAGNRICRFRTDVVDHNARPAGGGEDGADAADAAAGSRDDDGLVFEKPGFGTLEQPLKLLVLAHALNPRLASCHTLPPDPGCRSSASDWRS